MLFQLARTHMVYGSDTPKNHREHSIGMVHSNINSDSGSQDSAVYYLTCAPFAARAADGRPQFTDTEL